MPGVKLAGGLLICAGYQKSSVSLRHGQINFPIFLTFGEDAVAFADDGDRGGSLSRAGIVSAFIIMELK